MYPFECVFDEKLNELLKLGKTLCGFHFDVGSKLMVVTAELNLSKKSQKEREIYRLTL